MWQKTEATGWILKCTGTYCLLSFSITNEHLWVNLSNYIWALEIRGLYMKSLNGSYDYFCSTSWIKNESLHFNCILDVPFQIHTEPELLCPTIFGPNCTFDIRQLKNHHLSQICMNFLTNTSGKKFNLCKMWDWKKAYNINIEHEMNRLNKSSHSLSFAGLEHGW